MIRAAEYKENAKECRELAKRMLRPEDEDALERIAQIWERLEIVSERHPDPEPERNTTERLKAKTRPALTEQIVAFWLLC